MAIVDGGFDTAVTTRSGAAAACTLTVVADARQLFPSLLSATAPVSSAHASRKYVPAAVVPGTVTVTVPLDDAPTPSAGTDRLPVRSVSPTLLVASVER